MLPLFGAAAVAGQLTTLHTLQLLGVGISFHIFSYVLNDVIDLPLDRTEPLRYSYPLVRGVVSPSAALAFCLLQIPIAFFLLLLIGSTVQAYLWLAASLILMTVYNFWGKRCSYPLLTDFAQGCSWSALSVCGAATVSQSVWPIMAIPFVFITIYVLMINGIHGSLRDLANDFARGVHSTAIQLGARPRADGTIVMSPQLKFYAGLLQVLLGIIVILPIVFSWLSQQLIVTAIVGIITIGAVVLTFSLFIAAAMQRANPNRAMLLGLLHMIIVPVTLIALFSDQLGFQLVSITLIVYLSPYLLSQTLFRALWVPAYRGGMSFAKRLFSIDDIENRYPNPD